MCEGVCEGVCDGVSVFIVTPAGFEALVAKQGTFGNRRQVLLQFVYERNRLLLANSKLRESLTVREVSLCSRELV